MRSKKLLFASLFIFSLLLSIALFYYQDFFREARGLGLLGLFLVNAVSSASLVVAGPGFLSVIAGGAIYNPFLVAFIGSLGSAAGDMLSFAIGLSGRRLAEEALNKKIWFRVLNDLFKKHGLWILFMFSLVPNPLFDSIGFLAGAFSFSPWKFFIVVFVGRMIRFYLLALLGATI